MRYPAAVSITIKTTGYTTYGWCWDGIVNDDTMKRYDKYVYIENPSPRKYFLVDEVRINEKQT